MKRMKYMRNIMAVLLYINSLHQNIASDIVKNPVVSRGRKVETGAGPAGFLVDNKFTSTTFTVTDHSWIAINIGNGPGEVFFNWNDPNYRWSDVIAAGPHDCKQNVVSLEEYTISVSSNSTNGADGNWVNSVSVKGNIVTARGHRLNFKGNNWIRLDIIKGKGLLDEVEVFELSPSSNDLWFFAGTSISANTYKGTVPSKNYADLIHDLNSEFTPAMIRGGIPCINSSDVVRDLSLYRAMTKQVKFWAIEMGTNDAWGGSSAGVSLFKSNLQKIIDECKKSGIQPVLSRTLATNQSAAGWQVHPDYLKAVDELTAANNLYEGPDLYTWFLEHPSDLNSDGVHPNASGAANIQRLWAEKMIVLYNTPTNTRPSSSPGPSVNIDSSGRLSFDGWKETEASIEVFDVRGNSIYKNSLSTTVQTVIPVTSPGMYVLRVKTKGGVVEKKFEIQ